jgi:outer membrane protein
MTPDQRAKAEKELRDSARELERKKSELQDDSNAKRQEEMNKLQRSLISEVRDYAKSQNFDIVIADGVIYATPTVDITGQVLQAMQSRAPKPAAPAPATSAPAPAKPPAKP